MTSALRTLLVALFAVALAAPAHAQDAVKKAKEVCAACHGEDGGGKKEFPDYPKLAGQYADYLYHSLKGYKAGTRKNAIMAGMAQPLTDAEMRGLAKYYASQPSDLRVIRTSAVFLHD
jgi:cytochrome c553